MKMTHSLIRRTGAVLLATALLAAAPASTWAHGSRQRPRLVGYFTSWAVYSAKAYTVKSAKDSGAAERLTHLQYAFAKVVKDTSGPAPVYKCAAADPWADFQRPYPADQNLDGVDETWSDTEARGHFNQLRKLKALYPRLKVLISIGGWTFSDLFSDAALTPESRQAFVASCVDMFIKGNVEPGRTAPDTFDGLDVDWEFPGACGNTCNYRPEDTENFTALMAEFRRQLNEVTRTTRKRYELAIATPAVESLFTKMQLHRLSHVVDFMSIMGYDMHGAWERTTNVHAPLFPSPADPGGPKLNLHTTINAYLRAGVPRHKLVLGVPFFGRGWWGVPDVNHGLYQPAGGAAASERDYRDLAAIAAVQGSFRDLRTQGHWIYSPTTGEFWGYDDPVAVRTKARYTRFRGLGGNMFWELSGDSTDAALVKALHSGLR